MARSSALKSPKPVQKSSEQPLLNQENFEKELRELAAKAQEETWTKWVIQQAWILIQSAVLLTLAAAYSNVSLLTLSPVYGSIPSAIWHPKGVVTACFLGWSGSLFVRRQLPVKPVKLLPLIAAYIPVMQFFLFQISGSMGAVYGPIIIESLTFLPLLLLSVSCTATILDNLELNPGRVQWLADAAPGICSYAFYKSMEYFTGHWTLRVIGKDLLHSRLGLQCQLAALYSLFAPSKLLLYALPALLHTSIFNYHVPYSYTTSSLNSTMSKSGWSLIDRHESLTGYLSVFESDAQGFRVLRCDHSLLGGQWLTARATHGLPEPIYGVFVMLEAVRLMEVPERVPDSEATALVIGLGIGTTPGALMAHGIKTTIVEIDPVVHEYATKYFALPPDHIAVIADAVSYADTVARSGEQYDYVVHDVFTGGAEPVELFTVEFIQDLRSILKPSGVIAINYAGDLLLPSARIIVQTIRTIFPTCRVFRESEPSPEMIAADGRDFTNMVIFCTSAADAVTFRHPREADFLGSGARKMFLMPQHEVDERVFAEVKADGGILSRNDTERFKNWQQKSALGHWAVMRTVLPDMVWDNW
ncbi:Polyamine aminopropyltransferase [Lachnellula occidentalis]|uniref:Polyamine aminopropyltransferase n=1 Tax=Lachnellula occidentalis TaxID=215460 RepID=A0A8H8S4N7_9HELO|nr:Polyamine aminopropyltransferase [Lachnellula occidentalis]